MTDGTGLVNETGNGNEQIQRTYSLYTMTYDGDTRTFGSLSLADETALYGNPDYNRPFDVVWDPDGGQQCPAVILTVGSQVQDIDGWRQFLGKRTDSERLPTRLTGFRWNACLAQYIWASMTTPTT